MIKKLFITTLIYVAAANAFANTVTIKASQTNNNDIYTWKLATKDDGYFQILGMYDNKKFILQVAQLHNGKPADSIVINCDAGNGSFDPHEVAAGESIVCFPSYYDVISYYVDADKFKNGSEGIYRYEPYTTPKKN